MDWMLLRRLFNSTGEEIPDIILVSYSRISLITTYQILISYIYLICCLRSIIAHLQLVREDDIPRFKSLGVVCNYQPYWMKNDDGKIISFLYSSEYIYLSYQ